MDMLFIQRVFSILTSTAILLSTLVACQTESVLTPSGSKPLAKPNPANSISPTLSPSGKPKTVLEPNSLSTAPSDTSPSLGPVETKYQALNQDSAMVSTLAHKLAEANGGDDPGLAIGPDGNYFVTDARENRVLKVNSRGEISVYAGVRTYTDGHLDGPAAQSRFGSPQDLAFDQAGNLYVSESKYLRKISSDGQVSTLVDFKKQGINYLSGLIMSPQNEMFAISLDVETQSSRVLKISLDGTVSTVLVGNPNMKDGKSQPDARQMILSLASNAKDELYLLYVQGNSEQRVGKITKDGRLTPLDLVCQEGCPKPGNEIVQSAKQLVADKFGQIYLLSGAGPIWERRFSLQMYIVSEQRLELFLESAPIPDDSVPVQVQLDTLSDGKLSEVPVGTPTNAAFDSRTGDLIYVQGIGSLGRITSQEVTVLRDFKPREGKWNSRVILKGYHLNKLQNVSLGGIKLPFKLLSNTEIEVTVPPTLPYFKSTFQLDSSTGTYRSEVPFVLNESKRQMAAVRPYTGPLEIILKQNASPSQTGQIILNQHPSGSEVLGRAIVTLAEPVEANKRAIEEHYNTKLSEPLGSSYVLVPDFSGIDLSMLEANLRMTNALSEDPYYQITSAEFSSELAAKTFALMVELQLDDRITGAGFDYYLSAF